MFLVREGASNDSTIIRTDISDTKCYLTIFCHRVSSCKSCVCACATETQWSTAFTLLAANHSSWSTVPFRDTTEIDRPVSIKSIYLALYRFVTMDRDSLNSLNKKNSSPCFGTRDLGSGGGKFSQLGVFQSQNSFESMIYLIN